MRMKKIFLLVSFLFIFSTPAYSSNPLLDLPSGHWAYSAMETLASQGLISGYRDGTLRGDGLLTRYEAASIIARVLAKIDETKATQQQLKIVQNMCVELKDELDMLGVSLAPLEKDFGVFNSRLGGWQLSGGLHLDTSLLPHDEGDPSERMSLAQSRLNISRRFGADNSMFFHAQIDGYPLEGGDYALEFTKFYTAMDLSNNWRITVGKFAMDFEGDGMYYAAGRFADYSQGAWFSDVDRASFAFEKSFSLGNFAAYVAGNEISDEFDNSMTFSGLLALKPSEKFHADIGIDRKNVKNENSPLGGITTLWIMPKFFITDSVALKGAYYAQFNSYDDKKGVDNENPKAWRAILDVKQDALKFTSLWLEYNKFDKNFVLSRGTASLELADNSYRDFFQVSNLGANLAVWRVGLNQEWNNRWSSWLYYAKYNYSNYPTTEGTLVNPAMDEMSAGIEYRMNPHVYFSLGYFYYKFNKDAFLEKKRILNFRTAITF